MHLYLFILFHSHSSIQSDGVTGCTIWAGKNSKHSVSPWSSSCPVSSTYFTHIILFIVVYQQQEQQFPFCSSSKSPQVLNTMNSITASFEEARAVGEWGCEERKAKAPPFLKHMYLKCQDILQHPKSRTSFLTQYYINQTINLTFRIVQDIHQKNPKPHPTNQKTSTLPSTTAIITPPSRSQNVI